MVFFIGLVLIYWLHDYKHRNYNLNSSFNGMLCLVHEGVDAGDVGVGPHGLSWVRDESS